MPKKINLDTVKINRSGTVDFPNSVSVVDDTGRDIFVVDRSWSDIQIMSALKLANHSYDTGEADGKAAKAEQIRNVL